jgi:hypothetical protein
MNQEKNPQSRPKIINHTTLDAASEELLNDKEFGLQAVQVYERVLGYLSDELREDKDIVMAAVRLDGDQLKYASEELKSDKEVVFAAMQQTPTARSYASKLVLRDSDFLLSSLQDTDLCDDVSRELKNDKAFVNGACEATRACLGLYERKAQK